MFTVTDGIVLPTTVTGSWPRPFWYTSNLAGRPVSDALADARYREELTDAVAVVLSDQERAGLDILTNGDYHLDADLGGRSWMLYPVERLPGIATEETVPASDEWVHPPGSLLAEVFGSWRLPPVVGRVEPGGSLELDKLWRIAQARTDKPVKLGTVSTQFVASMLELRTDDYAANKRDLMWDMATADEPRAAQARRCRLQGHPDRGAADALRRLDLGATSATSTSSSSASTTRSRGLEDVEVWVHTCWGNANMQRVHGRTSYAEAIEIFLDRVGGDVWTVEMKDRQYADLELFRPYRDRMRKKIALGVVSHRSLQVETPEEVADDIRYALSHVDADKLVLTSDCGFGRGGPNRLVAFYKATAIAQGANIVRRELGLPEARVRAADPATQVDQPRRPAPSG